jgi:hypothetical protein
MRKVLIAAVFTAALLAGPRPAAAGGHAPWCAVISLGMGDVYWDCQYASIEACRPNVLAGNRGFCNPNPAWAGWTRAPEPVRRAVKHRRRHG